MGAGLDNMGIAVGEASRWEREDVLFDLTRRERPPVVDEIIDGVIEE